jgi:hypothetical protein
MRSLMAAGARVSPVREILDQHFSRISSELETAVDQLVANTSTESQERARTEFAEWMNQAARRMRQSASAAELGAALLDASGAFAAGGALLIVDGPKLRGQRVRGVPLPVAEAFTNLEVSLDRAPALAQAATTHDPITTLVSPAEVSESLADLANGPSGGRANIYPILASGRTSALLYVWGSTQGAALELLVQIASAIWSSLPAAPELVTIAASGSPAASGWESLSPEEQRVHLRAQRFARVQAAEMRLFETDAVQTGRARRDLYGLLQKRIDTARESFQKSFFENCPSMVDYLHLELVHTLANDDPELLGKDYPGPLV